MATEEGAESRGERARTPLPALYAVTTTLGAILLFLIQPIFARMVLPLFGGAPAVWNATVVFYQAALLGGYAYVHLTTTWLGVRRQAALHLLVLAAAALVLPVALPPGWTPRADANPIHSLLGLLLVAVGLPFFAVSATSPLLQRWLAGTGHRAGVDPYGLYGASNLGSMLALLAYPTLMEPHLRLHTQGRVWALGYAILGLLVAACAVWLWRARAPAPAPTGLPGPHAVAGIGVGRRIRWGLLAFVPSSLVLCVTTYLSTDIAAVPLLWVVPLALYLLSFTLTFARRPMLPHRLMTAALPIALLPLVMVLAARASEPIALVIPTHLATFFVIAVVCHGALARERPPASHLTAFYLWLAAGGVLGGAFTALAAPSMFTTVAEYPLMLVLACLLVTPAEPPGRGWGPRLLDVGLPAALGALATAFLVGMDRRGAADAASAGLVIGLFALACVGFARRPVRFGLGVGALMLTSTLHVGHEGRVLHAERSFFGIHRVTLDPSGRYHRLLHGTTLHGAQSLDPSRRREPLAYFHREGPMGQVFTALGETRATASVAVVGLGTGALACHGRPGQRWIFYEIDPAVERLARDPRYFTFLRDCPPAVEVALGDARLSLARASASAYGVIVLDAYSSDAPPVHLLTREAVGLYLEKLAADGFLAFNISNRHLDLEPVLGNLARDAGLVGLVQHEAVIDEAGRAQGRTPSKWVVMARDPAHLGALAADRRWRPVGERPSLGVWTDDFSALLRVFEWR